MKLAFSLVDLPHRIMEQRPVSGGPVSAPVDPALNSPADLQQAFQFLPMIVELLHKSELADERETARLVCNLAVTCKR
jgi:hypothetical protein